MPIPLRLLYGLNIDGRPKRVSMFPPSYADRAREREAIRHQLRTGVTADGDESLSPLGSPRPPQMPGMPPPDFSSRSTSPTKRLGREVIIKKDRLVIPRGKKVSAHNGNGRNGSKSANGYRPFVVDEGRRKSASAQTDVTFCAHECENHPKTIDLGPPAELDKAKRKGSKGQKEAKERNEEGQKVEKKEKHKKGKGKSAKEESNHSDTESGSEGLPFEEVRLTNRKSRGDDHNTKRSSGVTKNGSADGWDPAELPFLVSLLPGTGNVSKQEKQAIQQHYQETRELLAVARRADEEQVRHWVAQQLASTHAGALQWLRERDVRRQTVATDGAFRNPSDLLASLKQVDGHKKGNRVSFPASVAPNMPDPNLPLWPDRDIDHIPRGIGSRNFGASSNPLVIYPESDQVYTSHNSRSVRSKQGSGANGPPNVPPPRGMVPLQAVSGNSMHPSPQSSHQPHMNEGWQWKSVPNNNVNNGSRQQNGGIVGNQDSQGSGWDNNNQPTFDQDPDDEWPTFGPQNGMSNGMENVTWTNQNNAPPPNHPSPNMLVDQTTGIAFHPAESAPQEQFKRW